MKKIFRYLLKRFTKNEKGRVEVYKILQEQAINEYSEQTTFGNVYNSHIEFVLANEFICSLAKEYDSRALGVIQSGMRKAYFEAVLRIVLLKSGESRETTERIIENFNKDTEEILAEDSIDFSNVVQAHTQMFNEKVGKLINMTPSGEARNLITELNILFGSVTESLKAQNIKLNAK